MRQGYRGIVRVAGLDFLVDYDATYYSARISGPPENCYPADGELILNSYEPVTPSYDPDDIRTLAQIEDACWEHFHECRLEQAEFEREREWEDE